MSRARTAAMAFVAAAVGLGLPVASPPSDPRPEAQIQASIRAAVEAIGRQDEAAAAQPIEMLRQEGRGRRDALLMQQSLIDYLFAHVEARRQLCFASVELARAAGVPLEAR